MKKNVSHFRGCLLGGAIGDALGFTVEFMDIEEINRTFGTKGITDLICDETSGKAVVSDDTQMTIFTADGLLWADHCRREGDTCSITDCVFYSYQRWFYTQTGKLADKEYDWLLSNEGVDYKSELIKVKELMSRRGPGNTCLSALSESNNKQYGTIDDPINNSKGCGGIMRSAPVGLYFHKSAEKAFQMAAQCAAITHGHPSGYLSAGALACIISEIINDRDVKAAALHAATILKTYNQHEECLDILQRAITLSTKDVEPSDAVKSLGEGWVGEEALAIAVYCALKYENDFEKAVRLAVNHSGDSDSTGAICGNILGAYHGIEGIPEKWIKNVELGDLIMGLADRLLAAGAEAIG